MQAMNPVENDADNEIVGRGGSAYPHA